VIVLVKTENSKVYVHYLYEKKLNIYTKREGS